MYLNTTALGFDGPIDAMLGFHRRIERQLATLRALPGMLETNGPDASSMTTAASSSTSSRERCPFITTTRTSWCASSGSGGSPGCGARRDGPGVASAAPPLQAIAEGVRRTLPDDLVAISAQSTRPIAFEEGALHLVATRALNPPTAPASRGMAAAHAPIFPVTKPKQFRHGMRHSRDNRLRMDTRFHLRMTQS
jgi:hypothetical protein